MLSELIIALALVGAAGCGVARAAPESRAVRAALAQRLPLLFGLERVRVALAQAELGWMSPGAWIALRWGLSALAGVIGYLLLGLVVVGVVASLAVYHLLWFGLEARLRRVEARRQRELLDAIRFVVAVTSRPRRS